MILQKLVLESSKKVEQQKQKNQVNFLWPTILTNQSQELI